MWLILLYINVICTGYKKKDSIVDYCWLFDWLTLDCGVQVSQLGAAAQKYQTAIQNASSNLSTPELQNNCNM